MFTGIIQEIGQLERAVKANSLTKLGVKSAVIGAAAQVSDSIAVNGVCLTVMEKEKNLLFFQALNATLKSSNLKRLRRGDFLNLEPALQAGDKLGGHFVLGHVDGEAKLIRKVKAGSYWRLEVALLPAQRKFLVENGSVALEGISLTVKKIWPRFFTVDIIPFTYEHTNLKYKPAGDWLNIEFDQLLKKKI